MRRAAAHDRPLVCRAKLPDERRREARHPTRKLVPIIYNRGQKRVWLIQCSARGAALLCTEPMQVGEQFMIQLTIEGVSLLVYTVRNCRQERKGLFRIGGELVRISAPGELDPKSILGALMAP